MGEDNVNRLDKIDCQMTNRVGYQGACANNRLTEWRASIECWDHDLATCVLIAYYYTDNKQDQMIDEDVDIDWQIEGYELA